MDTSLVTTALELPGYRIVRNLGVVRGITVRSRSIVGKVGAALQTIVGGNISILTELCEHSRHEAFEILLAHAREVGANAIIAVRYLRTTRGSAASRVSDMTTNTTDCDVHWKRWT